MVASKPWRSLACRCVPPISAPVIIWPSCKDACQSLGLVRSHSEGPDEFLEDTIQHGTTMLYSVYSFNKYFIECLLHARPMLVIRDEVMNKTDTARVL